MPQVLKPNRTQSTHDAILIERSQLGDKDAFDMLFGAYHNKAFMYALRMTKHVDDASDLVIEGFMRINRALGSFQINSSFSTWMYRILRNCFLDTLKKRRVTVIGSLDATMESEDGVMSMQPIDDAESAFDKAVKSEQASKMDVLLEQLPPNQSQLLLLYYQQELTYDEIAQKLSTPAGTVKSRLHRAKSNLKELLKTDGSLLN